MPRSTTSLGFPDVNVWVALTAARHVHHVLANDWLSECGDDIRLHFCRFTQLGLLRLLTVEAVMGRDVLTQREAWKVYDGWLEDFRVSFSEEPPDLDPRFRSLSHLPQPAPKDWTDSYLAAFAETAQLQLVTFDAGFRVKTRSLILLGESG
jgi:toxin-antitoxin system PIN domain toxin